MAIKEDIQQPAVLNRAIHTFDSILAKRIFYALMSQLKKGYGIQKDIYNDHWLDVPTSILGNQNYKDLNNATDELQRVRFKFLNPDEESFTKIVPFPYVDYKKRSGNMRVKIEKEALVYLAELTKGYFWYKLRAALSLSSKYAQRWYELFSEKKDLKVWLGVEVEYLRTIMGVEEWEYKKNADFFRWIVYDPIEEINQKTELFVTYKPMMGLKKPIIGFDFSIQTQKEKGESEAYKRIEDYYESLKEMTPREISNELLKVQQEYNIPVKIWNEIQGNKAFLNEVLATHASIEAEKVTITTTKAQYMGGAIKRIKSKLGIR